MLVLLEFIEAPFLTQVLPAYLASDTQVWLITVYDKDEAADPSPAERRVLKSAIDEERRQPADSRRGRGK